MFNSVIAPTFVETESIQYFPAEVFPTIHPVDWLNSHFAVGGWSPLQRLSGMLTAHMTRIAPQSGFTWHPHRGLEIYSWMLEGTLYHEDSTGGKGLIAKGELQRMFSGAWIEHQELNMSDDPVRLIQIWFIADPKYRDLDPHYQQVGSVDLPVRTIEDAKVFSLIGDGSPMQHHINGRLTASIIPVGGATHIEAPAEGEDLFLYVTDGTGTTSVNGEAVQLKQYDVLLARPDMPSTLFNANQELNYLCFYLPTFLP